MYPSRGIRADGFERSDPSKVIPAEESEWEDSSDMFRAEGSNMRGPKEGIRA